MTKVIRVIHLGDLHLASAHSRSQDRRDALVAAVKHATESGPVALWVWPGDLNHAAMSISDRNFLAVWLQAMAQTAPVVICYGNHDAPGDLDVFAKLQTEWPIYVVNEPQVLEVEIAGRRHARIFVLPYPRKAIVTGVAHADAMDGLFAEAGEILDAALAEGRPALMIGHVTVAGALSSCGQPAAGGELEVTQAQMGLLGGVPKLLNHIHKHQRIGGAVYAGSLCRLDWGEVEPKGYGVLTFDETWRYDFVSLAVPPLYHVEGDWTSAVIDGTTVTKWRDDRFAWAIRKGPGGDVIAERPHSVDDDGNEYTDWSGCDVRVRMRYAQAEQARLSERRRRIENLFQGVRRLEIEPIAVPDRALRAPAVVAAKTFDEKLQAWAEVSGVDWSAEIMRCAALLQQAPSVDPADEVRRRLTPLVDVTALMARDDFAIEVP